MISYENLSHTQKTMCTHWDTAADTDTYIQIQIQILWQSPLRLQVLGAQRRRLKEAREATVNNMHNAKIKWQMSNTNNDNNGNNKHNNYSGYSRYNSIISEYRTKALVRVKHSLLSNMPRSWRRRMLPATCGKASCNCNTCDWWPS